MGNERYVLHPSVAALWWVRGEGYEKALRLRRRLRTGDAHVVTVAGMEQEVVRAILRLRSRGLRSWSMPEVARIDVFEEFDELAAGPEPAVLIMQAGRLSVLDQAVAVSVGITEYDLQTALLSESLQLLGEPAPLILADAALRDRLAARPRLRTVWMDDYH